MKVALLQTDIRWAAPEENIRQVEQLIGNQKNADLYVLPEMWTTGFATKPMDIAEEEDSSAGLAWMTRFAREHDCAISGSLCLHTLRGDYRNRHYFVTPQKTWYYDKHHLFTYGHEDRYITSGQQSVVAEYRSVRFLLLTCYDLRFPVWARYGRAGEYDVIICVANWPESRQQAWRILTKARAIENQCYLIGVNRVGDDEFCHYRGESLVADSKGNALMECLPDVSESRVVELDMEQLAHIRSRFQVLADRDRE